MGFLKLKIKINKKTKEIIVKKFDLSAVKKIEMINKNKKKVFKKLNLIFSYIFLEKKYANVKEPNEILN